MPALQQARLSATNKAQLRSKSSPIKHATTDTAANNHNSSIPTTPLTSRTSSLTTTTTTFIPTPVAVASTRKENQGSARNGISGARRFHHVRDADKRTAAARRTRVEESMVRKPSVSVSKNPRERVMSLEVSQQRKENKSAIKRPEMHKKINSANSLRNDDLKEVSSNIAKPRNRAQLPTSSKVNKVEEKAPNTEQLDRQATHRRKSDRTSVRSTSGEYQPRISTSALKSRTPVGQENISPNGESNIRIRPRLRDSSFHSSASSRKSSGLASATDAPFTRTRSSMSNGSRYSSGGYTTPSRAKSISKAKFNDEPCLAKEDTSQTKVILIESKSLKKTKIPKQHLTTKPSNSPNSCRAAKKVNSNGAPRQESGTRDDAQPKDVRLSTEVLQLQLLHSSALRVLPEWERRADTSLRRYFADTATAYKTTCEHEHAAQSLINQLALQSWCLGDADKHSSNETADDGHGDVTADTTDNIALLITILDELPALLLSGEGNSYACIVSTFDGWIKQIQEGWRVRDCESSLSDITSRPPSLSSSSYSPPNVRPLPQSWHSNLAHLNRKIEALVQSMRELDSAPEGSTLAEVLRRCKIFLVNVTDEIREMSELVEGVYASEKVADADDGGKRDGDELA